MAHLNAIRALCSTTPGRKYLLTTCFSGRHHCFLPLLIHWPVIAAFVHRSLNRTHRWLICLCLFDLILKMAWNEEWLYELGLQYIRLTYILSEEICLKNVWLVCFLYVYIRQYVFRRPVQLNINHKSLCFLVLHADSVNLQSVDGRIWSVNGMKATADGSSNGSGGGWMIWCTLADGLMDGWICRRMEDGHSVVQ